MPASLPLPGCRPFTQPYDRAERVADAILHAAAGVLGITAVTFLLSAAGGLAGLQCASVWIYGIGLISVLATSAAYNLWPLCATKLILRRFDQSAIYLFIAASYTPFLALADKGIAGRNVLIAIWAAALLGMLLKLSAPGKFERLSVLLCLALGWSGMLNYEGVFGSLEPRATSFIVASGALYSAGVAFHLWDKLRFQNAIWHAFVVAAAGLQFFAVLDLVVATSAK